MTVIKQAAIYYSASTVYELFHLESVMSFCFVAKLVDHVSRLLFYKDKIMWAEQSIDLQSTAEMHG